MVDEKQFEDAVAGVEKMQNNGISKVTSSRTLARFQSLKLQLVSELNACCSKASGVSATISASLFGRFGMADHARQVVLGWAEAELLAELRYTTENNQHLLLRTINVIFNKKLAFYADA